MRASSRILAIAIFIAAGFAGWQVLAQTAQLPAGPPGGVNASKLPDVEGVHLGMTVDQATAVMKSLFPGSALQTFFSHYQKSPMWVARLEGGLDQNDVLDVSFSPPPNPQQTVLIQRHIVMPPGKQPTLQTIVTSLRQKYGQDLPATSGAALMAWAYDEQGQPVNPQGPANWRPVDCGGAALGITPGETLPGQGLEVDYVLGATPLASLLPGLTSNLCNKNVFIKAQLDLPNNPQPTTTIDQISISLSENPLMLRNAVAGQQYLDGLQAEKQQQQLKQAQQQKAPSL
jgi:hypothetical protein